MGKLGKYLYKVASTSSQTNARETLHTPIAYLDGLGQTGDFKRRR